MHLTGKARKLIWVPRLLLILFILSFSMFALDAFTGDEPFLNKLAEFLIHLIPSFVMVLFMALFWKRPAVSGWTFIVLGIVFTLYYRTYRQPFGTFLIISLPPMVIGALFLVSVIMEKKKLNE